MTTLAQLQPALISLDAHDAPVVIPIAELRYIARGLHSATDEQVQALARYIIQQLESAQ